jgi:hypothetical protein
MHFFASAQEVVTVQASNFCVFHIKIRESISYLILVLNWSCIKEALCMQASGILCVLLINPALHLYRAFVSLFYIAGGPHRAGV